MVCPPTERNSSAVEQHMRSNIFPEGLLEMYTITEEQEGRHRRCSSLLCRYLRLD